MDSAQKGDRVQGWILDQRIGSGSFATVWKAFKADEEAQVAAIKIIVTDKLSTKLRQSLGSEISILKRISHQNVVHLFEVVEAHNRLYLVMEFCSGGDVADYLRKHKRVSEATARSFLQQLSTGLQELWRHHFVHRDLKPQNLLLSDTSISPIIKIADFGFARDLQPQRLADTLCGSPLYMAPEILQFHKYDAKADLWSVGVILYELVVGKTPFDGNNYVQLLRDIEREEACVPEALACQLSPACVSLIGQLLKRNPVERIAFEEFFQHPFLTADGSRPEALSQQGLIGFNPLCTLPTIASGIVLPISAGDEEQLPFAVLQYEQAADNELQQDVHAPAVAAVKEPRVPSQQRQNVSTGGVNIRGQICETSLAGIRATQDLFDEDDYVIIEKSPSSSASLRAFGQSTAISSAAESLPQTLPNPLPTVVPLLIPINQAASSAPTLKPALSHSMVRMRFSAGVPRSEAFKRIALLLEDLAFAKQEQGGYEACLAFRLLSLQVLSIILGDSPSADSSVINASFPATDVKDIAEWMRIIASRADQVGAHLQLAAEQCKGLPDVWELVYQAALAHAKAAAVEELLSNYTASVRSYAKAGALLFFMFESGVDLPVKPQLHLTQADQRRLQRYTACIALRHQGCLALAALTGAKKDRPSLSSPFSDSNSQQQTSLVYPPPAVRLKDTAA